MRVSSWSVTWTCASTIIQSNFRRYHGEYISVIWFKKIICVFLSVVRGFIVTVEECRRTIDTRLRYCWVCFVYTQQTPGFYVWYLCRYYLHWWWNGLIQIMIEQTWIKMIFIILCHFVRRFNPYEHTIRTKKHIWTY